jgi:hypothetical protein
MNNRTYQPALKELRFYLSLVELVSKAKRCGKENCSECPHAGYWYAVVQAPHSLSGKREELYIGREWTHDDLTAKIAGRLTPAARAAFAHFIARELAAERTAEINSALIDLAGTRKRIAREAQQDRAQARQQCDTKVKQITANEKSRLSQLAANQRRLTTELAQIKKGRTP